MSDRKIQTIFSRLSWRILRRGCDGDEVLLEDVDVPAQLGHDRRDGGGGQVARQDEEGAALVQLAVNLLPLRQLALLAQALELPDKHTERVGVEVYIIKGSGQRGDKIQTHLMKPPFS